MNTDDLPDRARFADLEEGASISLVLVIIGGVFLPLVVR